MTDERVCLITGATNGIGLAAATELARRNYHVVLHGRNAEKLAACQSQITQATGNEAVSTLQADLASLDDVRSLAADFLATGLRLHCLLSNAGVTNNERRLTVDGYEEMFAVNHLAPFLLSNLLLENLTESGPARIVVVASAAHSFHKGINFDDLSFSSGFKTMKVYGHSKLANILFTRELAKRMQSTEVTVNSCHPGMVATGLGTNNGWLGKVTMKALTPFARTPEKGAETAVFLADSPDVAGLSGGYYNNCKIETPKPWAEDDEAAKRLWAESAAMTGLDA